jgi:hypothetical protein
MKKLDYLTPETGIVLIQTELNLCLSRTGNASIQNFDVDDEDFDMFDM